MPLGPTQVDTALLQVQLQLSARERLGCHSRRRAPRRPRLRASCERPGCCS